MRSFQDRVAVVTGAASGIGRATSIELARRGCHLALADVQEEALEQTAAQVRELGRNVSTHVVDVSDRGRMERFVEAVVDVHGGVHILVNNAGVTVTASFEDHSLEDWEWIMGINFWGVLYGCKLFLPHLMAAEEAHIVNLSSLFGLQGMPLQTSYCASKFAVRGLSESLWIELRQHGIGVTSVHPGGVRTSIAQSARVVGDEAEQDKSTAIALIENSRVSPEQCAKMIVGAIKRNKPRLLVAPETHLIESLKRLAPTLPLRLIESGYARGMHRRGGS